jgi:hypothetical protein
VNCCAISNEGADASQCLGSGVCVGRKDYRCVECHDPIPKGTRHEFYKLVTDGSASTERTCLVCAEIRSHFSCDGSWIFGEVWDSLHEALFPTMTAGGECLTGLSPAAKAKLFDACLEYVLDEGHRERPVFLRSTPAMERFQPGEWMHPELVLQRRNADDEYEYVRTENAKRGT